MCIYLPPSSRKYKVPPEQLEIFIDGCLKNINHSYPKEKFSVCPYLLGDFNLPACNWKLMTSPSHQEQEILNFLTSHSLEPLIHDTPTHHRGGTLDNVLTDAGSAAASTSCQVRRDLLISDHFPIEVLNDPRILSTNPILPTQYCFNLATNLNKFVESWIYFSFDASSTINDVTTFYDFLWNIIRTKFQRKQSKRKANPFYYSSLTMHTLNQLNTARKRAARNPTKSNRSQLPRLASEFEAFSEMDKICFINGSMTTCLPDCFALLLSLKTSSYPKQMFYKNKALEDPIAIANCFNNFFEKKLQRKLICPQSTCSSRVNQT